MISNCTIMLISFSILLNLLTYYYLVKYVIFMHIKSGFFMLIFSDKCADMVCTGSSNVDSLARAGLTLPKNVC